MLRSRARPIEFLHIQPQQARGKTHTYTRTDTWLYLALPWGALATAIDIRCRDTTLPKEINSKMKSSLFLFVYIADASNLRKESAVSLPISMSISLSHQRPNEAVRTFSPHVTDEDFWGTWATSLRLWSFFFDCCFSCFRWRSIAETPI